MDSLRGYKTQILVFCRRIWTRQTEQTNLRHHVQDHRDDAAAHHSGQQPVWQHRYIQGSLVLNFICMDGYVAVLLTNGTITNWLILNVNYWPPLCLPVSLRGNVIGGWWIMFYVHINDFSRVCFSFPARAESAAQSGVTKLDILRCRCTRKLPAVLFGNVIVAVVTATKHTNTNIAVLRAAMMLHWSVSYLEKIDCKSVPL